MAEILTRYGEVKELAKLLKTSDRTVYSALKGHTNSKLASQIRTLAIKRGGAEAQRRTC